MSSDRKQANQGLSVTTLMIASASSMVAALVVSKLWGGGTLIGAAVTPVIVALVSEGLRKPAHVIVTVRQGKTYDPVAEGRRGLAEGDLSRAHPARPGEAPERRVHRASGGIAGPGDRGRRSGPASDARGRTRLPRRRVMLAVATGLIAFVVAGFVLTGSELVLGNSVVSSSKRTTLVPARTSQKSDEEKTKTDTDAKTTPTDTTTTETTPEQQQTAPATTTTAPDGQTPQPNSVPAAPPPEQTAPAPSPAPNAPVPSPPTTTPAPAQ